jgi:hypothetical protein
MLLLLLLLLSFFLPKDRRKSFERTPREVLYDPAPPLGIASIAALHRIRLALVIILRAVVSISVGPNPDDKLDVGSTDNCMLPSHSLILFSFLFSISHRIEAESSSTVSVLPTAAPVG